MYQECPGKNQDKVKKKYEKNQRKITNFVTRQNFRTAPTKNQNKNLVVNFSFTKNMILVCKHWLTKKEENFRKMRWKILSKNGKILMRFERSEVETKSCKRHCKIEEQCRMDSNFFGTIKTY